MTQGPIYDSIADSLQSRSHVWTGPRHLEFVTTAQMSLDARAFLGGVAMNTVHLVGDSALIIVGAAFALAGYVLGYLAMIVGVLFLFVSQVQPFQRWLVKRYRGSLLGQPVTVDVDEDAMHFASPLASTTIPWSTVTTVRSNDRTVVFLRGHAPVGYVPAAAFASRQDLLAFVEDARQRVNGGGAR